MKCIPCAKYCSNYVIYIHLIPISTVRNVYYYYSPFVDERFEAQLRMGRAEIHMQALWLQSLFF